MAGVVLDPGAIAELAEHVQVVEGPLFDPLGLDELALRLEIGHALLELLLDPADGASRVSCGRGEERPRMDHDPLERLADVPEEGIDRGDPLDLVARRARSGRRNPRRPGRPRRRRPGRGSRRAGSRRPARSYWISTSLARMLFAGERLADARAGSSWRNRSPGAPMP